MHHLANLCVAFSHLNGSISVSQGAELMEQLAAQAGRICQQDAPGFRPKHSGRHANHCEAKKKVH